MVVLTHHKKLMGEITMKNTFKILIAEDSVEFLGDNTGVFEDNGFEASFCDKDGSKVLECIKTFQPDVVLMDMFMSSIDAVGIMRAVKKTSDSTKPLFVILSSFDSPMLEREALSAGAVYYAIKPFRINDLVERISELITCCSEEKTKIYSMDKELEITITDILHQIGVPAHIKGYHYLRDSIILSVKQPEIINAVTKELYPSVAKKYDTTSSRVERAIRHAIEVAWDRGDVDILNSYFGIHNGRGKPTNSEFVAMISDRLRLQRPVLTSA